MPWHGQSEYLVEMIKEVTWSRDWMRGAAQPLKKQRASENWAVQSRQENHLLIIVFHLPQASPGSLSRTRGNRSSQPKGLLGCTYAWGGVATLIGNFEFFQHREMESYLCRLLNQLHKIFKVTFFIHISLKGVFLPHSTCHFIPLW